MRFSVLSILHVEVAYVIVCFLMRRVIRFLQAFYKYNSWPRLVNTRDFERISLLHMLLQVALLKQTENVDKNEKRRRISNIID